MASYCKSCGSPLFDASQFCGNCGNKTEVSQVTHQTIQRDNNEKNKNVGLLAAAIVLLLITGFIGLVAFMRWYDPSVQTTSKIAQTKLRQDNLEKLIGVWELTRHPSSGLPEIWTFKENYDVINTYGFLMGRWSYIDADTLVIHFTDDTDPVYQMYLSSTYMILIDEEDHVYSFMKESAMIIDADMTVLLNEYWDYKNDYPSKEYTNLKASVAVTSWMVNVDGVSKELPVGFIRFDNASSDPAFVYCMYSYYDGELIINFDPTLSEEFMESYIIVG